MEGCFSLSRPYPGHAISQPNTTFPTGRVGNDRRDAHTNLSIFAKDGKQRNTPPPTAYANLSIFSNGSLALSTGSGRMTGNEGPMTKRNHAHLLPSQIANHLPHNTLHRKRSFAPLRFSISASPCRRVPASPPPLLSLSRPLPLSPSHPPLLFWRLKVVQCWDETCHG